MFDEWYPEMGEFPDYIPCELWDERHEAHVPTASSQVHNPDYEGDV